MENYKDAIIEINLLKHSLIQLTKDLEKISVGCIGPGQVSLYLGDNWFVSVQRADALGIIERRIEFLNEQKSNLEFSALKSEMSEFVEIVEEETGESLYVMPSNNEFCKQEANVGEFEANIFKVIRDLELQCLEDAALMSQGDALLSDGSQLSDASDHSEALDCAFTRAAQDHVFKDAVKGVVKKVRFKDSESDIDDMTPVNKTAVKITPVKQFIVERQVTSIDDDSDLENYHFGQEISKEYVALRDKLKSQKD